MKHFNNLTFTDLLPVIVSTVLILPNMYISILSSMSAIECAAQLTLPFAMYMMIMSSSDNTPRTSLLLFPMMFFAAFQIVVSYLYNDGAPIGVDMFLNVWTTNMTEVDELLSGIALPVIFVVAAYLPLTVAAIMMWRRRRLSARSKIKLWRRTALVLAAAGMTACVWCITSQPGYEVHTRLFPVNVFYNLT